MNNQLTGASTSANPGFCDNAIRRHGEEMVDVDLTELTTVGVASLIQTRVRPDKKSTSKYVYFSPSLIVIEYFFAKGQSIRYQPRTVIW